MAESRDFPNAFSCPTTLPDTERVQLGHGSGGKQSAALVRDHFLAKFSNEILAKQADAAVVELPSEQMAVSTDTFVVNPLEYPGGNIGSLSVHGTLNDLAMMGAEPRYLTAGFVLEEGVDLFIKRAWYETTDFLSPDLYRRFVLPHMTEDVRVAHQAGAKFGLITTSAYVPLLDMYVERGMDALIGVDPVQDVHGDLALTKQKLDGRVCLWGGVNGSLTVERGSEEEVRAAVREAVEAFGQDGGFVLSPVDNVRVDTELSRKNVDVFIDEWRACRNGAS